MEPTEVRREIISGIPQEAVGLIIGKHRRNIDELKNTNGITDIRILSRRYQPCRMEIIGTEEAVRTVSQRVYQSVCYAFSGNRVFATSRMTCVMFDAHDLVSFSDQWSLMGQELKLNTSKFVSTSPNWTVLTHQEVKNDDSDDEDYKYPEIGSGTIPIQIGFHENFFKDHCMSSLRKCNLVESDRLGINVYIGKMFFRGEPLAGPFPAAQLGNLSIPEDLRCEFNNNLILNESIEETLLQNGYEFDSSSTKALVHFVTKQKRAFAVTLKLDGEKIEETKIKERVSKVFMLNMLFASSEYDVRLNAKKTSTLENPDPLLLQFAMEAWDCRENSCIISDYSGNNLLTAIRFKSKKVFVKDCFQVVLSAVEQYDVFGFSNPHLEVKVKNNIINELLADATKVGEIVDSDVQFLKDEIQVLVEECRNISRLSKNL
mmetsp:Transcript_20226/g.26725  ORF Transcript_20226/g.26725 Transcript_20226/m.26725 type:complete len:431 (+) Transcript_20226:114-1406(+)